MSQKTLPNNPYGSKMNRFVTVEAPLKYEIYSFIGIVSSYFSLQPILTERIEYIFIEIWHRHTTFFNRIRYENAVLGIMIFALEEFHTEMGIDNIPVDITEYAEFLYGKKDSERNLVQIYSVYQNIVEIFEKPLN